MSREEDLQAIQAQLASVRKQLDRHGQCVAAAYVDTAVCHIGKVIRRHRTTGT